MTDPKFFNAHHSPVGAFATLTLGCKGPRGGFGLELGGPANEGIYVGIEESEGRFRTLPFYGGSETAEADYDVEGLSDLKYASALLPFPDAQITRRLGAGIDEWRAGDLVFRIISPPKAVPDPELADAKNALAPSVLVELTVDNSRGDAPRRAFFGYGGSDRSVGMRILDEPGLIGVGQGTTIAIASADADLYAGIAWQPEAILSPRLEENLAFMLGSIGLIVGTVPAGEVRTFRFAVGFFREGTATTGIKTRYLYRRWFDRVEEVLHHALVQGDATVREAQAFDDRLRSLLSPDRAFMAAHALRSYFGSTQLLERGDGRPLWVVHEGEYRMMNTFDLTVDQAFLELALNPWTVRNVLDLFVERYSYMDGIRLPNDGEVYTGGIAFTHDMGIANAFSTPGRSGYEQAGLTGCFSYMSSEELMNWVLCAGLYVSHTNDVEWAESQRSTLLACLESMLNRDHPDPAQRNGVMGLDGARCAGGAEITTYDSLDASLGQARNNLYLAVKGWATYLLLADLLRKTEEAAAADEALAAASRAAQTVVGAVDENGLLPAVIGEGVDARIIPAIEALVYPFVAGLETNEPELVAALRTHFEAVLKPGLCKFADGGWRLSSTSRNSWLSKIYLCQYVAENILGHHPDTEADKAHVAWLVSPENGYFAWSDQMLEGKAVGSRYYPRGVTSILWTSSGNQPIKEIREALFEGETAEVN
jgi:hypothetical protein